MRLLISAIASSFDSLIIGINFKLNKTVIKKNQFFMIFLMTTFILILLNTLLSLFSLNINFNYLNPLIYFIFALESLKKKTKNNQPHLITLLALSHSCDSFFMSLTFIKQYNFIFLSLLFSLVGTLFALMGYKSTKNFKNSDKLATILFLILTITSLFQII